MSSGQRLLRAVDGMPALDAHAHVLARPEAAPPLARVLTECDHAAQLEHVRHQASYHRAVRDLAAFAGCEPGEAALDRHRREVGATAWARGLLGACRYSGIFVDDGFTFPGAAGLEDLAALAGCPVHRVLRIESTAEEAGRGSATLDDARQRFRALVDDALDRGAVALKTIAAYRCGLDLDLPDAGPLTNAYRQWRAHGFGRLSDPALVSFFVAEALDAIKRDPVPVQVHTGLGDLDLDLRAADPLLLRPLLAAADHRIPFVLLHCYPYVSHAAFLAAMHANVYVDLSLAMTLASPRGPELVLGVLEQAPVTKLLFATDASRLPESFFIGTRWWRQSLAWALGRLVDDGLIAEHTAVEWAGLVLEGNATRLYGRARTRSSGPPG